MNLYRLITFIAIISLGLASNTANAGDGHHQARGFKGKLVSNYHYGKKRYHHSKKRYYHGKKHFRGDYYNHFHKKKYRKFKKKRAYKHYYGHHYSPYHYKKKKHRKRFGHRHYHFGFKRSHYDKHLVGGYILGSALYYLLTDYERNYHSDKYWRDKQDQCYVVEYHGDKEVYVEVDRSYCY